MAVGDNDKAIKRDILKRVKIIYILFILAGVVMTLRIGWIQLVSNEVRVNSDKMLNGRIFSSDSITAHRGSILSRNGEALATSILRYQVEMDFGSEGFDSLRTYHIQSDSLSKLLSAYFRDKSAAQYREMFRSNRTKHYQLKFRKDTLVRRSNGWINRLIDMVRGESMMSVKLYDTIRNHRPVQILPREVDYAEWQVLRRYPILNWNMGLTYSLVEKEERVYSLGDNAKRTIGALMADRGDDYGIEKIYNKELKGEDGYTKRQRIARGFYGRVAGGENRDAVDGMDVVTTIDTEIQDIAETALLKGVQEQNALWGTAVVMEVKTGDILAIANLDRRADGSYAEGRNRAIGARAEPGSTFKVASTMALLEVAGFPTKTIINSENGARVKVGNATVADSHREGFEVDLHTAFTKSLNVYFAKAIYENFKDDPNRYTDFLKKLHLDRPMGLEAFGEQSPRLPEQSNRRLWTPHMTLVNMAYGYGVELSPIQTLTLCNAVANNGRMMAPRLVSEIRKGNSVVERFAPRVLVDKIASQPTLDTLRMLMRGVCEDGGTGYWYLGRFNGFKTAAKTGTAQFAQDGYQYRDGVYIGTMEGFMPAEDPKYSVISILQVKIGMTKSIYGAGVSGPVVKEIMQQLYNREPEWHTRLESIPEQSLPVRDVKEDQELLAKGEEDLSNGVMPKLFGLGLRDAVYLLESHGIKVNTSGVGSVWRQSVRAGERIRSGNRVELTLR